MTESVESIDEISEMWEKDSVIKEDLKTESLKASKIHSKYLTMYTKHSLRVKKYTIEYTIMKKTMWRYYAGKFSKEEYEEHNLEPFRESLKSEIAIYLESDPRLIKIQMKKIYHEEAVDLLKVILKEISSRQFHIKNAIEWYKMSNGVN